MPVFTYNAVDSAGRVTSGDVTADNAQAAREQLHAQGLSVTELHESVVLDDSMIQSVAPGVADPGSVFLSESDQAVLVQQVGELVTSKVPLSVGLRALAEDVPSSNLRVAFLAMSKDLESGMSLELVFARWSSHLPSYFNGMVMAGSRSQDLGQGLTHFAEFLRCRTQLRRNVQIALLYPALLLGAFAVLFGFLLVAIVPKFKSIFEGFGTELPSITELLIEISNALVASLTWWPATLLLYVGLPIVLVAVGRVAWKWPFFVQVLYLVPFYGPMLRYRGLAEFSLLLSMMIRNGVRLTEALRLAGDGASDANLAEGAYELSELVQAGISLPDAVSSLPHFGLDFRQVVSIGRRDGVLADSLTMASELFAGQTGLRARLFGLAAEPGMVLVSGFGVGFVVIALFMPLIKLLNDLS